MVKIKPFKALRYHVENGLDANDLVTQPYDKITPEEAQAYAKRSPYNVVRLIKDLPGDPGAEKNFYERSLNYIRSWQDQSVLIQEKEACFYVYKQTFTYQEQTKSRIALVGLTRLHDYEDQVIFPHERTLSGPKADRIKLLETTQTHFGQVFLMYQDPQKKVDEILKKHCEGQNPLMQAHDQFGVLHEVWKIADSGVIQSIQQLMEAQSLVIADGHHRYEAALNLAKQNPNSEAHQYLMTSLVNGEDLLVLPTHRLIHSLKNYVLEELLKKLESLFEVTAHSSPSDGVQIQKLIEDKPFEFVLADHSGQIFHLKPRNIQNIRAELGVDVGPLKSLDVVVLHQLVFQKYLDISLEAQAAKTNISYFRDIEPAFQRLRQDSGNCLWIMNPCTVSQVFEVAQAGGVMPQKSTDFYPKMLTGLLFYKISN